MITKRRNMPGIPQITIAFGEVDPNPFAPLHRRLGILTQVRLQAVTDYRGGFDRETGQYWSPHEFRARISLART